MHIYKFSLLRQGIKIIHCDLILCANPAYRFHNTFNFYDALEAISCWKCC